MLTLVYFLNFSVTKSEVSMGVDSGGSRHAPSTGMTATQLCQNDDITNAICIDSYLGFQTHKMDTK